MLPLEETFYDALPPDAPFAILLIHVLVCLTLFILTRYNTTSREFTMLDYALFDLSRLFLCDETALDADPVVCD